MTDDSLLIDQSQVMVGSEFLMIAAVEVEMGGIEVGRRERRTRVDLASWFALEVDFSFTEMG